MKTSGFREIDFSKIECKNCGRYQTGLIPSGPMQITGMVFKFIYEKGCVNNPRFEHVDCPVCKGTGHLNENGETELELE